MTSSETLEPGGAPTTASAEADWSPAITGQGSRGSDQGGDRRGYPPVRRL